jgi:hypothetical protein
VAANDPLEDATANQVIRRDEGDGDLLFFSVMDGHGGFYTSQVRFAESYMLFLNSTPHLAPLARPHQRRHP